MLSRRKCTRQKCTRQNVTEPSHKRYNLSLEPAHAQKRYNLSQDQAYALKRYNLSQNPAYAHKRYNLSQDLAHAHKRNTLFVFFNAHFLIPYIINFCYNPNHFRVDVYFMWNCCTTLLLSNQI